MKEMKETLREFLEEVDATFGIAIKAGDSFLYMKDDGTFTDDICDSKEFIYECEVIERVTALNEHFDEDMPVFYISVYANAVDDSLCDIFTLRDLKRNFEEFKKDHALAWTTKFPTTDELGINIDDIE